MKVIALINNKGGVGKTTSTQNIGAGLAKFANARVLLIDLDSQANLTKCYGINPDILSKTSGSFIAGESTFAETVMKTEFVHLLPANKNLTTKEDTIKANGTFPFVLKIQLEKIKDQYDFVLIDCPPALGGFTRSAIVSCDAYFVPFQVEFLSYEGLRNLLDFANEIKQISPNVSLGGVFATRFNPNTRKRISNDLVDSTREQLQENFMITNIRDNVSIQEAQAQGVDVFSYAPDSNGAQDYYELTKEIISRL